MPWIPEDDSADRCGPDPGGVKDPEHVVKFVGEHEWSETLEGLDNGALESNKICEQPDFSDTCGDSDGVSVVRSNLLTEEQIFAKQAAYCARSGFTSKGPARASVSALRAIRLQNLPDTQVVFVMDDPIPAEEPLHAVIRISVPKKPRGPMSYLRDQIRSQFGLMIPDDLPAE